MLTIGVAQRFSIQVCLVLLAVAMQAQTTAAASYGGSGDRMGGTWSESEDGRSGERGGMGKKGSGEKGSGKADFQPGSGGKVSNFKF